MEYIERCMSCRASVGSYQVVVNNSVYDARF
jgi:hypothetical protein